MRRSFQHHLNSRALILWLAAVTAFFALGISLASCGRSCPAVGSGSGTGSVTVNLSDPPSCPRLPCRIRSAQTHSFLSTAASVPARRRRWTVTIDANGNALNAIPGSTVPVKRIDFSGCS